METVTRKELSEDTGSESPRGRVAAQADDQTDQRCLIHVAVGVEVSQAFGDWLREPLDLPLGRRLSFSLTRHSVIRWVYQGFNEAL